MRKNKKDKKQDINYLDLIPETNQSIRWHRDLKQRIILEIENKGMFNTIAQKVFGKPRFSKVHLDEMELLSGLRSMEPKPCRSLPCW